MMKKLYYLFGLVIMCSFCSLEINAQESSLDEGFEDGIPDTWEIVNNTQPAEDGVPGWFQGDADAFPAHSGTPDSYAASDYELVANPPGVGTISSWMFTPELVLSEGAVIKFWTRTFDEGPGVEFPDRLEVRLSTNGASTDVGTFPTSTGDFTTLLVSVNPDLTTDVYPRVWTEYTATLSGITAGATGRIAFRYYVSSAGALGDNSDWIGVDDVSYSAALPVSFINFDGFVQNSRVQLNWSTSTEINNKGYDVERSINGRDFSAIGFVQGNGNTTSVNDYTYTDVSKFTASTLYYRLKQIDFDGKSNYSSVLKLNVSNQFSLNVFPNPIVNNAWVQFQLPSDGKVTMQLVSSTGKILQVVDKGLLSAGTYSIPLNLNQASKGTYFIKMIVGDKTYTQTVVK